MLNVRLIKKSGIYFIGNFSSKVMGLILIPIYAFYILPDDLGYFDYIQTIMNIVIPVVLVSIWEGVLRYGLTTEDEDSRTKILSTAAFFSIVSISIYFIVAFVFQQIFDFEFKHSTIVLCMMSTQAISMMWQFFLRALELSDLYVKSSIFGTVVHFFTAVIAMCAFGLGIYSLFFSTIIANIIIFALIEKQICIIRKIKRRNIDLYLMKKMLIFSAPLVLNTISMWLITGFGRYMITNYLGTDVNGQYAFASRFGVIVTTLGSVVNMAVIEEAIISSKNRGLGRDFGQTIEALFKLFQSMVLLVLPATMIFYYFIQNTEYYESYRYVGFFLIYAALMTMSTNLGSVFQATDKTKYQFITSIIGGGVSLYIIIAFIKPYGLYAVIIGQIFGALSLMLSRYFIGKRLAKYSIKWKPIIAMLIIYILSLFICLNTNIVIHIINLIISGIIVVYVCNEYVVAFYKFAHQKLGRNTR